MLTDEQKEIVRSLNQPHRFQNVFALFKICEKAATLIQDQAAEIDKMKQEKPAPKKRATKS